MRLRNENLTVDQKLEEFDQWLTAKLERIKNTDKFSKEINMLCGCIRHLAPYLNDFSEPEQCSVDDLVRAVIESGTDFISGLCFSDDERKVSEYYDTVFNLLFLTTGATDNNLKNHFLIKLKEDDISGLLPKRGNIRNVVKFNLSLLPATTKSGYIAKMLAS